MIIKLESDLHLDFRTDYTPNLDGVDIYVLAGDIGEGLVGYRFCKQLLKQYEELKIIYVAGNHEFYCKEAMEDVIQSLQEKSNDRFIFLNDSSIIIDDIKFIGSTLWTSYDNMNPLTVFDARNTMNDYRYITTNRIKTYKNNVSPYLLYNIHQKSKKYIFNELDNYDGKNVVITHHQPYLSNSISDLKFAFEVDLTNELDNCKNPPMYWFSGHTHKCCSKEMYFANGKTTFMSNCLGYPAEYDNRDTGFDNSFVLEM